jgi:hypothetical protein
MRRLFGTAFAVLVCAGALVGSASAANVFYVSTQALPLGPAGGSCTLPNFNTIQGAVLAAAPGDTIIVCDGVYFEQVTIDRDLTLFGSGNSVIAPPAGPLADAKDLVTVTLAAKVAMSGFVVSGPGPGLCGSIGAGVRVDGGATLDLSYSTIRDIRDNDPATSSFSGCQNGEGIRVGPRGGDNAGPGHATIDYVTALDYQKNGFTISGAGSTANIMNSTVRGAGPTTVIAQNGIQVSFGASATINTSTVRDHDYTPNTYFACGLLIVDAAGVNDDQNVYLDNEKDKCTALGRGGTTEGLP